MEFLQQRVIGIFRLKIWVTVFRYGYNLILQERDSFLNSHYSLSNSNIPINQCFSNTVNAQCWLPARSPHPWQVPTHEEIPSLLSGHACPNLSCQAWFQYLCCLPHSLEFLQNLGWDTDTQSQMSSTWFIRASLNSPPAGHRSACWWSLTVRVGSVLFRNLNKVTKAFPLPRIEDRIDQADSAKFVSKFNLLKGYLHLHLVI